MHRFAVGLVILGCLLVQAPNAWGEDEVPPPPAEPPVEVIEEVPPPVAPPSDPPPTGELPPIPADPYDLPVLEAKPQPPAPRLRRRTTPPWRLNIQAGFSLLDEPEGTLGSPPAGLPSLSWDVNDYEPAIGGRLTLARCFLGGEVEGRATYYGGWEDDSRQTGAFGFANVFGQSPTATTTLESQADLFSVELNYWRDFANCSPQLRWGVGVRYINFEESAEARNWIGLAPDSFLNGEAENEFIGGQVLGSASWEPAELVTLELSGRAFFGSMGRDVIIDETSILSGGSKRATDEDAEFGWGFEIGLDATFCVNNCLSITAGYALLYLDEVQRAHDALDFSRGRTGAVQAIQNTDSIWVHSFFVGLQFRF